MKTFKDLQRGDVINVYASHNDNVYWTLFVECVTFETIAGVLHQNIFFIKNSAYEYLQSEYNDINFSVLSLYGDEHNKSRVKIDCLTFDCSDGTEDVETPFQKIVRETVFKISTDLNNIENCSMDVIEMVLKAHNSFYRNEKLDFSKVIYDITNQSDLKECVREGLTAEQIATIWKNWINSNSNYFTFDINAMFTMLKWGELRCMLTDSLQDVVSAVITRPTITQSYGDLYSHYVSPIVIEQIG